MPRRGDVIQLRIKNYELRMTKQKGGSFTKLSPFPFVSHQPVKFLRVSVSIAAAPLSTGAASVSITRTALSLPRMPLTKPRTSLSTLRVSLSFPVCDCHSRRLFCHSCAPHCQSRRCRSHLRGRLFEIEFCKIFVNLRTQFDADALENVEQIIVSARAA